MEKTVTAALIIIGNEILSGRTQDANLAHIALKLNGIGVQLREVRVIPDVEDTIVATVNTLRAAHEYVFTTGGIGPTHDDITSAAIAKAFGVPIHRHPEAEKILRAHYSADMINEARLKMADVPVGATLLDNPVSSAPGFRVGNVYVMAGVPRIMQAMLDAILPELRGGAPVLTLTVTTDLPEGDIAHGLTEIQHAYADVEIGSYPMYKMGSFSTSLVLRSPDGTRNEAAAAEIRQLIATTGGNII